MKKILILITLLGVSTYAGEIKETFLKINKEKDRSVRIEMKLNLILKQYMLEEEEEEVREEFVDSTIEKTKKGISEGASWLKKKSHEMLGNEDSVEKQETKK